LNVPAAAAGSRDGSVIVHPCDTSPRGYWLQRLVATHGRGHTRGYVRTTINIRIVTVSENNTVINTCRLLKAEGCTGMKYRKAL